MIRRTFTTAAIMRQPHARVDSTNRPLALAGPARSGGHDLVAPARRVRHAALGPVVSLRRDGVRPGDTSAASRRPRHRRTHGWRAAGAGDASGGAGRVLE